MISYLQIENLTKSFGAKVLFENISFGVAENQRIEKKEKNGINKIRTIPATTTLKENK